MKVFVTGANGRFGRVLVERLAAHPEVERVTGVDRAPPKTPLPAKTEFLAMDVRSPDLAGAMAGHDVVIHTAFIVFWPSKMPEAARIDVNVNGTRNVCRAALANQVRRFIHTSSTSVYMSERSRGVTEVTEETPIAAENPSFYYSHDKILAERALIETFDESSATVTIFRPTVLFGPSTGQVPILRLAFRGRDMDVQSVHEDDVISACIQAATTEMPGIYNVAADDAHPYSVLQKRAGKTPVIRVPCRLVKSVMALFWNLSISMHHPSWLNGVEDGLNFTVSNAKLRATGWAPTHRTEELANRP